MIYINGYRINPQKILFITPLEMGGAVYYSKIVFDSNVHLNVEFLSEEEFNEFIANVRYKLVSGN